MITACEARSTTLKNLCKQDKLILEEIEAEILNAANSGYSFCSLVCTLTDDIILGLEKLGYTINVLDKIYVEIGW